MSEQQKSFVLAFDPGVLTRVAGRVRKSRTAVHLVFRGKTHHSPIIAAALVEELRGTLRRMRREMPPGCPMAFRRAAPGRAAVQEK